MVQASREGADGPVNHSAVCSSTIVGAGAVRPHRSFQLHVPVFTST